MSLLYPEARVSYKDAARMKNDTDLDPLRGCEDFKKLVAELVEKPMKP